MVTDTTGALTDLELLHRFIGDQIANGGRRTPVDRCLAEFREYLREVERCREGIRPALERSLRGETPPFDPEALKVRVTRELADRGIAE